MANRMRFGVFAPPFHTQPGLNPSAALHRDVDMIELLDRLGYDEAWVGEHHSGGAEFISSPEVFLAHVANRTKNIKLGLGVISLPYHNPLWVAERAIMLDHLTRGRVILGIGPGSLPTDAAMIGLETSQLRPALEEDAAVLMHLLTSNEPISHQTDRYKLVDAMCQLRPYSHPRMEVAAASAVSPAGARLAGEHGLSLLSIGATMAAGTDMLAQHWDVVEQRSAECGTRPNRDGWRLVGPMHLAETREKAYEEVSFGINSFFDYEQQVVAVPQFALGGTGTEERIDWLNNSGVGVIGTPDDAIKQIEALEKQSNGGFGCYLMLLPDWVRPSAMRSHLELFAEYVMPHFQGSRERVAVADQTARTHRTEMHAKHSDALKQWTEKHRTG